jgi:hypothetical protein
MPFSLAAENAKRVLLRCFKNMIPPFRRLVKRMRRFFYFSKNLCAVLCKFAADFAQNKRAFLFNQLKQNIQENTMKKILAIFALLALTVALFACGDKDKNKTSTPPATTTTVTTERTTRTTASTTVTSGMTTPADTASTTRTNSHPTETGGTTASQSARGGTMPELFTMPPTGTAPGGSTSVR